MLQQLDTAIGFVVVMLMLSLLVTAMVQAISAFLDLRGKNLVRSLATLFKQVDPTLGQSVKSSGFRAWIQSWFLDSFSRSTLAAQLADLVTTHPMLAHSWTRAKAVRKDELWKVLQDLQDRTKDKAGPSSNAEPALDDRFSQALKNVDKRIKDSLQKISALQPVGEKWFDTIMDRASDVFTRWTRVIAVTISALLVIVLHLDAGAILHQIASNPDIRAGLVKLSDNALAQADDSTKAGQRGSTSLQAFITSHNITITPAMPSFSSCAQASAWFQTNGPNDDQLQKSFLDDCREQAAAQLKGSEEQIKNIRAELASTNLRLVPAGLFGNSRGSRLKTWTQMYWGCRRHVLGVLAMVVLLSLGAPFWFNALKQLSNLKPAIGQKIEKETASSQSGDRS